MYLYSHLKLQTTAHKYLNMSQERKYILPKTGEIFQVRDHISWAVQGCLKDKYKGTNLYDFDNQEAIYDDLAKLGYRTLVWEGASDNLWLRGSYASLTRSQKTEIEKLAFTLAEEGIYYKVTLNDDYNFEKELWRSPTLDESTKDTNDYNLSKGAKWWLSPDGRLFFAAWNHEGAANDLIEKYNLKKNGNPYNTLWENGWVRLERTVNGQWIDSEDMNPSGESVAFTNCHPLTKMQKGVLEEISIARNVPVTDDFGKVKIDMTRKNISESTSSLIPDHKYWISSDGTKIIDVDDHHFEVAYNILHPNNNKDLGDVDETELEETEEEFFSLGWRRCGRFGDGEFWIERPNQKQLKEMKDQAILNRSKLSIDSGFDNWKDVNLNESLLQPLQNFAAKVTNSFKPSTPELDPYRVALYELILKSKPTASVAIKYSLQDQIQKADSLEKLEKIAGQHKIWSSFKQYCNYYEKNNK